MVKPSVAFGHVMHQRLRPVRHGFAYPVFFVRVPLSSLASLRTRWLSVDRFNVFSLRRADFGPRDGRDAEPWVRAILADFGVASADGEIVLQAFPRVLGYAFNPIAIFHCHDREGRLRAAVCEVSNTFGERHNYVVAHPDGRPIGSREWLEAAKVFHVSPFCKVEGHYRFRFGGAGPRSSVRIDYHDAEGRLLATAMHGREEPLDDARLARAFFSYPLMTFGVIARIHVQALRLWLRRVPWFAKPDPPLQETTR